MGGGRMETYDGPAWRLISTLCGESATRSLGSFHAYVWGWIRWDVPTVYYKYAKQTWHCRGALSLPTLSTCPPLSSSPPREQLCNRSCSNKHTRYPGPRTKPSKSQSTKAFLIRDCQEWCGSQTFLTGQSVQGQSPPSMLCLLERAASVRPPAYARGRVRVCVCVCACVGLHEPHHSVISTRDHHRSSGDLVIKG